MDRPGLTRMTKIEVVVAGDEAAAVESLFHAAGATGYTAVSGVSGLGHHGHHQGRLLFNQQATLRLLITVLPDEKVDALVTGLRQLLGQTSGVMFVSETHVSRPEYFG
ncbi:MULTISPECIES: P-II family nitrogen regulator [Dactylosporangium]|uniref:Nitrogen regulatory protein P-II n=2 Tax=Dactylosporangium TaxID=35753 RepID=A0A9W6KUD5_9ACTN|nr:MULTISPECIES: DUF190 domain-containing protein [Dactylosporangium]UAB92933.1 DUF190 domain-containing protein [Dactylosporangium vinaceum]UWZ41352.1 DUF190 domain-containing protein [Dactylosporangium matsuzakiense]GLL08281.1 nitrogen regulatory protein P-II [Dactylosporangium matsuzakiense]